MLTTAPAGYRMFVVGPTRDKNGKVWSVDDAGQPLQFPVWGTAARTNPVSDLLDADGNTAATVGPLPASAGIDEGTIVFFARDNFGMLYLDRGEGRLVEAWATEVAALAATAGGKADAASEQVADLSVAVDDFGQRIDRMLTPDLDITSRAPTFVAELRTASPQNVGQSYLKDAVTGGWWVAQAWGDDGNGNDSNRLHRLDSAGNWVDYMTLKGAGHGTKFGVQHVDDGNGNLVPYIWWGWAAASAGGSAGDVVRFPYAGGITRTRDDASVEVLSKFDATGTPQVGLAEELDLVCVRVIGSPDDTYTLRRLSDYVADVDDALAVLTLPADTVVQGFAFDDSRFYLFHGAGDYPTQPIEVYDWSSGGLVASVEMVNVDVHTGQSHEPESAQVYVDPASGIRTLFVGIGQGTGGLRRNLVYAFTPPGGPDYSAPTLAGAMSMLPVVNGNLSRKPASSETDMRNLTTPGWYHLEASAFAAMTDKPATAPAGAYFMQVSSLPWDHAGNAQVQQMWFNDAAAPVMFWRISKGPGVTASPWFKVTTTAG